MTTVRHTPRRVLVTGGAGFIGAQVVHSLLAQPALQVVTLDALTYAADLSHLDGLDPQRHHFVHGNIADASLVAKLLREHHIDTVMHLAAESHVDRSIEGPAAFVHTNVVGTLVLLEAAREAWLGRDDVRFHHVSTDEVYGDLGPADPAFTEATPYAPSSPYSASKAASDHLVRAWHRTYGLPVTLSNCSNNYGPRQHAEKLMPTVIRHCLARTPIPVYGRGTNVRDWLHVADHADALWHIVRYGSTGETYNVGGGTELPNLAVVEAICRTVAAVIGTSEAELLGLIAFVTDRPGHDRRYAIDAAKLADLGWMPARTFTLGLEETVRWYVERHAAGRLSGAAPAARERLNQVRT